MKFLIPLFFIFLVLKNNASATTGHCGFPTNINSIQSLGPTELLQKDQVIIYDQVAKLIAKIIDLKFYSSNFIKNSPDDYRNFLMLSEKIKNLKSEESEILQQINKLNFEYKLKTSQILSEKKFIEKWNAYLLEKSTYNANIKILREKQLENFSELKNVKPLYYKALAKWQPNQDYLIFYNNLEKSLIKSLDQIESILENKVEKISIDLFSEFKNLALQSNLKTEDWLNFNENERNQYCYLLNQKWIEFIKSSITY